MGYAVEDESAKHNAEGRRAGRNGGPPTFFPVAPQAFLRQELELLEEGPLPSSVSFEEADRALVLLACILQLLSLGSTPGHPSPASIES